MTRQSEHQAKRAREGYRKVQFLATPETLAALAQLRARGAKSLSGERGSATGGAFALATVLRMTTHDPATRCGA